MRIRLVCLVVVMLCTCSGNAADIHVRADGNDSNPGTVKESLQTLGAAQKMVRSARAAGSSITVYLHRGVYYLPATMVFTAEDSGTAQAPVIWQAAGDGEVVISGGIKLELQWEPFQNGILQAQVPAGVAIDQLFVDGTRQVMARYPNFDPAAKIFNGVAADCVSPERAKRWHDPAGGFLHAMHAGHWGGFSYRITGKEENGQVKMEGGWQGNRASDPHANDRYVENVFEELDVPGEWFFQQQTHTLYFYPPAGIDLQTAVLEAARLRNLLQFTGTEQAPVRFVSFRGMTFRHTVRTFMETREPLLRSDWTICRAGAVLFDGAENCALEDAFLDQVGGNAVFVNNYNRHIAVRGCRIDRAGANGVMFVGDPQAVRNPLFEYGQRQNRRQLDMTPGPRTGNYPADCLVEDCLITMIGRVEKQATGVGMDMAARITVRHCSIYDVPRAGINIGDGCWGGHLVEFCDVFNTVLETGDHGSFNSWGRDRFWMLGEAPDEELPALALLDVVEPNILRDSRWRCDHGWDIDLDDGSSNYHIYNNLCLNGGIKNREGFHRTVENNIILNNGFHPHVWYPNSGDIFRRNILFAAHQPAIMPESKWGREVDYNLYASSAGDRAKFAAQGCDAHSLVGDPKFEAPDQGDFRVQDDSPARQLGFQNFSMDQFGVQKRSLKAIAKTPEMPEIVVHANTSGEATKWPRIWQDATVRNLAGEEYSAFAAHFVPL